MGISAGAKAVPTGAAIASGTGYDVMCLEVLSFCEVVLPDDAMLGYFRDRHALNGDGSSLGFL